MPYQYTRTYPRNFRAEKEWYVNEGGSPFFNQPTIFNLTGSRSGNVIKGWKDLIAKGENASTEYIIDDYKLLQSRPHRITSTLISVPNWPNERVEGFTGYPNVGNDVEHVSMTWNVAEAAALRKVYALLDAQTSSMNSPAVVAEFMDVLRQFGRPFQALVDLTHRRINRLELERRGLKGSTNFKSLKWKDIVASTYLEWSFGVRPLIEDTKHVAESVARWRAEVFPWDTPEGLPKPRDTIRARGKETKTELSTTSYNPAQTHFDFTVEKRKTTEMRIQYVVKLQRTLTADYGSNERLLEILGFSPENWIPAAWEVVPWSWLADYFLNINQILDASVTSTAAVKWVNRAITRRTLIEYLSRWQHRNFGGLYSHKNTVDFTHRDGAAYRILRTLMWRSPNYALTIPPLVFHHPFEDTGKLANMAAVLLGRRTASNALWLT